MKAAVLGAFSEYSVASKTSGRYAECVVVLGHSTTMTLLQLTDGKEIRVSQDFEEIRGLLQKAIAEGTWLELHRDDGTVVGINPANVSYIQNTTAEGPGPAQGGEWHSGSPHKTPA